MAELSALERKRLEDLVIAYDSAPYLFYVPNGACMDVTEALGRARESGKRIILFSAANGVGKTTWWINAIANLFYEDINERFFNYPLFNGKWPYPKTVWVITEDHTLREVIDSDDAGIGKWFPKGRYSTSKDDKGRLSTLKTDNGWTIFFKTVDQNPRKFESTTIGMVIYDEPPPYDIHKGVTARLRTGGFILGALTPLEHGEWIIDQWIENEDLEKFLYVRYASVYENLKNGVWKDPDTGEEKRSRNGRLTQEDIDFMASQFDETDIDARMWGKFKVLKGRVYKNYVDDAPYVIDPFDVSNIHEYQIFNVVDPHDRRYPAVGWYAIDKTEQIYVVYEWPNIHDFNGKLFHQLGDSDMTIDEISTKIKEIEAKNKFNVVYRYIDPNFGTKRYGNTGYTVQEEFEINDLYYDSDVVDDLMVGHSKVRENLVIGAMKRPKLQVFDYCMNHRWAFKRYRYKEHQGLKADLSAPSEKVVEKAKDFMDLVRYFIVSGNSFTYNTPKLTGWRAKLKGRRQNAGSFMGA